MNAVIKEPGACIEDVPLKEIAAKFGSPVYVYSKKRIVENFLAYKKGLSALDHTICYAVKANSNLAILNILRKLGSGFDIVSGGELARCLQVSADPKNIVFSGVGKSSHEIKLALVNKIGSINIESYAELKKIHEIAKEMRVVAPITVRVNPNVDANTRPYIATGMNEHKFGVTPKVALQIYQEAQKSTNLEITGVDCHIGSQITTLQPFADAILQMLSFIDKLKELGITCKHLNVGGGLGVDYESSGVPEIRDYCGVITSLLQDKNLKILLEPGRSIVADSGMLITKVEYIKKTENKNFVIVDAAMNDCLRPALYSAYHHISTLNQQKNVAEDTYDIVGPICESGDFLGQNRKLAVSEGDYLLLEKTGAYGYSMASNYNSRPRCAEVLVDSGKYYLIRERESVESLYALENIV